MDKFKKYLQQKEADMDADTPSPELWQRIRGNTPPQKNSLLVFAGRYAAAASVILLLGAGIIVMIKNAGAKKVQPIDQPVAKKIIPQDSAAQEKKNIDSAPPQLVKLPPGKSQENPAAALSVKEHRVKETTSEKDIAMIGNGYSKLINMQIKKVSATPVYAESPGYFTQFAIQLKQMDADEINLKRDVRKYGFNDQFLEQLINVYQQKLNLLKSLQQEINKMNNRVKENQGPLENPKPYFINL